MQYGSGQQTHRPSGECARFGSLSPMSDSSSVHAPTLRPSRPSGFLLLLRRPRAPAIRFSMDSMYPSRMTPSDQDGGIIPKPSSETAKIDHRDEPRGQRGRALRPVPVEGPVCPNETDPPAHGSVSDRTLKTHTAPLGTHEAWAPGRPAAGWDAQRNRNDARQLLPSLARAAGRNCSAKTGGA